MLQVTGVSITPDSDQLLVLHLHGGNDLVLCLQCPGGEERIGEFVGTFARFYKR